MKKLIIILSALLYANQTSASDIGTQMNNLSNFVKRMWWATRTSGYRWKHLMDGKMLLWWLDIMMTMMHAQN